MNWVMIQSLAITCGVFAVGFGYLYSQFRTGGNKSAAELITILQAKDVEQRTVIADYQNKFEAINKELGILEGKLVEKEKKLSEYMLILQGRSPETVQYMEYMREFTKGVADYMHDSATILSEMKVFMAGLNEKATTNQKFIANISESTSSEVGKPLLKSSD